MNQLWWNGDLSPNAAERRSSVTLAARLQRRRSSLTQSQSVSDVLRRNSSLGSGLDFSKIGKVAPITEDPSAEEFDGRSHLENRVPPLPPG